MSFRYTPTPTPSITPTISLTPSLSPSYTPTGTVCPGLTPTATSTSNPTSTPTGTPTSTPGLSPTPSYTPTTTPSPAGGELYVYAKYVNAENVLQYQVNYGTYEVIGNIDSLSCTYIYTITGLVPGDVVYFTTYSGCILALDTPPASCPNSGFACSQTYNFTTTDYVYITVDGSTCC
jgi:hypothetical protein